MIRKKCWCALFSIVAFLQMSATLVVGEEQEKAYEDFASVRFDRPTVIDNRWLPLKPGTRFIWDGTTVDEEGDEEAHSVVFTVTDLTKEIGGVRTVVCWDRDLVDGELVETEICFFAQDNDGNVWLMGEYPEEYEDGEFVAAPCWIHGVRDAKAGIIMPAEPKAGSKSYSQGWAPSVEFTDRAVVVQTGEKKTVPTGNYENVLVIEEFNNEEPDARQLKFYAPGVGNIGVGWRGDAADQEILDLIKIEKLGAEDLANASAEALALEKNAYEVSKDAYAKTNPSEQKSESAAGQ